ncbi:hypothetical protein GCM10027217_38600 [Pseudomaricurvus hydrocarbonicus]
MSWTALRKGIIPPVVVTTGGSKVCASEVVRRIQPDTVWGDDGQVLERKYGRMGAFLLAQGSVTGEVIWLSGCPVLETHV